MAAESEQKKGQDYWGEVEETVWRRVPVWSVERMSWLKVFSFLGEGSFGRVDRVRYHGEDAIRKSMTNGQDRKCCVWEAWVTLEVEGAGGAPRLRALTSDMDGMIMDYVGEPLNSYCYKENCTLGTALRVMLGVVQSLAEVHGEGFLHNDIKDDNILVSGPSSNPSVHVIDFRLATKLDDSFYFELFDIPRGMEGQPFAFFNNNMELE